ncbi:MULTISPECIES: helix-turn-helix domain-containing protein [Xanthocytophaga]|uniref:Helix-turn-helix domain-containing protein n=1 Tax=Xanthocytophaga agilis TaxID=3048010 RepID=A0AAE3QWY6_9BACT|nr:MULTISPECIES: helix-turn-helix domain-containing protein [Xanthocytophaga]MDJ1468935.1 helix-turn-helix domain-containing protein [Xanthocytophaga flavus]MDJ1499571.1 helix-turn-helix domain-containing protein [Xanthocytophaga agilis]
MKDSKRESICSVDYGFQRIGGKYKCRLIWYIHTHGIVRYGVLRRMVKGITPKMLTQTLRELEEDKLVIRTVYHEVPPKVEYSLTPIAEELIPFIQHVKEWADRRLEELDKDIEPISCD